MLSVGVSGMAGFGIAICRQLAVSFGVPVEGMVLTLGDDRLVDHVLCRS